MSLTTSDSFNPVISDMLNKIGQNRFVGLQILGAAPKATRTGTYPIIESAQFDNDASEEVAPGAKTPEIDFQYGQGSYKCLNYKLGAGLPIEDENQANDDGFSDAPEFYSMQLQRNLMVGHERRVKDIVFPTSSPFNSTAATAAMSSKSTAKPIEDIQNAVERLNANGHYDNLALIIESSLWIEMKNTDDVRAIFNGNGQYTDRNVLLEALGVSQLIITPTRYNSAAKGKTATRTKVWPDDKYLVAQVGSGDFSNGGIGRTIAYQPNGGLFESRTYFDEDTESTKYRVKNCVDEVLINSTAGELITGA